MTRKKRFKPKDEELLREAERILDANFSSLIAQRELVLEVFRTLLDQRYVTHRINLVLTPEQTTILEGKLYDHIAAVISNTYVELGDVAPLADDEALGMIRNLLLDFDSEIIDRNRFRRHKRWLWRNL